MAIVRSRSCLTSGGLVLSALTLMCFLVFHCNACSCMLGHPQMHYCRSDYAVVARVKSVKQDEFYTYYGVKISKQFKMSEKASLAFKTRPEISTPRYDSLCGIQLEKGQSYLITGRLDDLKPRVHSCDFYRPWANVTTKMKKGFRLLYKKGCNDCKIVPCRWSDKTCKTPPDTKCAWDTVLEGQFDCQGLESVCMRQSSGKCGWNRSIKFRQCLKSRKEYKQRQRELEP